MPFSGTKINLSRFEVEGKHLNSTGLDAFIYPERDIYRPGERVNFSVLIRDHQWKNPGEIPVKMKFLYPSGKECKAFRKILNEQGSAEGSVDIAESAITGSYTLEVYNGNDVLLASRNFMIEEFIPDRIKVSAKLEKSVLLAGESTQLAIHAENFFGPPASNRNYENEIQIKEKEFHPKAYAKFDFSVANKAVSFDKIVKEGKTDEKGNATESFEVKDEYKSMGLLQANFYTTVFDETGRPVSRITSADIYTQATFFGIGQDGWWYYPLNQLVRFPVIALDRNEHVTHALAKLEVIKHEYRTVLTKNGDYFRYESQTEDRLVGGGSIDISGENTTYNFTPRTPGEYELRVYLPGANSYVKKAFYSYGGWGNDNASFEVSTEGNIDIEADRTNYQTGDKATILFKAPFSGRMLVTLETDKLLFHQYVEVQNRTASLTIPIRAEYLPNVYVTATLFKPHDVSDIPLTVAHGFQSLRVEEKSRRIPVTVVAQANTRSRTRQRVKVKAAPGSYVTLAAVDNGVLQVSDFKTPDAYGYFYAKRALDVDGFDLYPLLFPEVKARLSSTGGDGDVEMNKRVNPMPNKRVKIVSYWSGITKASSSGEANFEFDVPAFSGELRLMALAYKNESFGSAEFKVKVADPVVISTALPRFLAPKDTVSVPLTITNTTSRSTSATATIQTDAGVRLLGAAEQTVSLAANSESRVEFRVVAAPVIGTTKIAVDVKALGEHFKEETELTIRPASTLQKITGSGTLEANKTGTINIGLSDFMNQSIDYSLVISKSPVLELGNQFNYLLEYPYGCTEQTVSVAFPQLYYGDLADLFNTGRQGKLAANYNIQEAIRKIKLRQLYTGGISLWDGEDQENWWSSIYAAHFLTEAKKAGYDVDKNLLQTLLGFIGIKLRNRLTINYTYNVNKTRKIVPKEVPYSLYVLALNGTPDISTMNYYKAIPGQLALDSRYLLSAAFALSGDKQKFKELLPASFEGEVSVAQTGGSFYSDIRDESIALSTLLDVDPGNNQVPVMAKHIVDKLKQRKWYSTQESAFSFLALGKLAKRNANTNITATISANGKQVANFTGKDVKLTAKQLGQNNLQVSTQGTGQLYYWWKSEGISSSGAYTETDNYLKVRRRFFDRYGRVIQGNTFKQNDLVIVQLTLDKSYDGSVDNIVLTDLLPAGFEIENPRTKEIPGMEWIKDADTPTSLDVRDDRINLFVNLNLNRSVFYYAVRAVSPGIFRMGPASADAMYNAEYHSYNGGGVIKVIP